jgi:hypothetical protein
MKRFTLIRYLWANLYPVELGLRLSAPLLFSSTCMKRFGRSLFCEFAIYEIMASPLGNIQSKYLRVKSP